MENEWRGWLSLSPPHLPSLETGGPISTQDFSHQRMRACVMLGSGQWAWSAKATTVLQMVKRWAWPKWQTLKGGKSLMPVESPPPPRLEDVRLSVVKPWMKAPCNLLFAETGRTMNESGKQVLHRSLTVHHSSVSIHLSCPARRNRVSLSVCCGTWACSQEVEWRLRSYHTLPAWSGKTLHQPLRLDKRKWLCCPYCYNSLQPIGMTAFALRKNVSTQRDLANVHWLLCHFRLLSCYNTIW